MTTRHPGDIAYLTTLTQPSIGIVLNIGTAHVGQFGNREAIAAAEGELVEALPDASDGGIAIHNADDNLVAAMAQRTSATVLTYGTGDTADIRATDIQHRTAQRLSPCACSAHIRSITRFTRYRALPGHPAWVPVQNEPTAEVGRAAGRN